MLMALTKKAKGVCGEVFKNLNQVSSGAAPLSGKFIEDFLGTLPHVDLVQGYGMTESTAVGTRGFNSEKLSRYSSVGLLAPNMQAKVVDWSSGSFLSPGNRGELWIRRLTTTTQFGFPLIGDHSFADVDNLEHCIKYLNQSLVTYGFSASLDLFATDPVSIARTCNCIYALIQQRQRDVEFRESSNDQRQRLLSDMARLEGKIERLETQLQAKERELGSVTRTEAKNTAALKAQNEKLQKERDEFQRMVIANQQVKTQQLHETKKKEKEYIKLQERLNQVLMEKKKETRSGMEIMNLLQKEGRQRGTWSGKKADSDFYKKIVDAYEAKNQELMAENTDLRALLRSTQGDMRSFLNASGGLTKQSSIGNGRPGTDPSQSPLGGKTDVFDLPFRMARGQIEDSLRSKMVSIKERMGQLVDAQKEVSITSEASERELELEAQLVEARSIIQEQESIMAKHLPKSDRRRNSAPPQSVNGLRG